MNDVTDLLVKLKSLGARIYNENDRIKLDIEPEVLTSEIAEKIKFYREDILTLLKEVRKNTEFV
ncbi:MAG: hypothetical protein WBA74_25495, partial [Cyclobacteriaceae bacterium]